MSVTISIRNACFHENRCENGASPFDMNLSNRNFSTFWSSLGFDPQPCGEAYPKKILERLKTYDPELALRDSECGVGVRGCEWYDFGISIGQVIRYVWNLRKLCEEAERREEFVIWG